MIEGIPTTYAGTKFRSNLEARWACTFDLLGVNWHYEPCELGDRRHGYVPDFFVDTPLFDRDHERTPTLVEVRPCLTKHEFREPITKIAMSGYTGPAIVVGAMVFRREYNFKSEDRRRIEYAFGYGCHQVKPDHAQPNVLSWNPTGWCQDGEAAGKFSFFSTFDIRPLYREASARVQWQPKR